MLGYINYSLVILALLVALLILLHLSGRAAKAAAHQQGKAGLNRKLAKVPTPWGWPQYARIGGEGDDREAANGHARSAAGSFRHWAGGLAKVKHTVDDADYRRKREGCLRTLLEDRYASSTRSASVPHANDPLVRTPVSLDDRTENASQVRTDTIGARLLRRGQTGEISFSESQPRLKKKTSLKDLKMPWGW